MMQMEIWMCPQCDKPTSNFRKCRDCHTPAVLTTFALWPLESRPADDPATRREAKQEKLRKEQSDAREAAKAKQAEKESGASHA